MSARIDSAIVTEAVEKLRGYEDSARIARMFGLKTVIPMSPAAAESIFALARRRIESEPRPAQRLWLVGLSCFWLGYIVRDLFT